MAELRIAEPWEIGARIKRVRKRAGLSGREMNTLIGGSNNLASVMEAGERLTHERLVKIANVCAGKGDLTDDAEVILLFILGLVEDDQIGRLRVLEGDSGGESRAVARRVRKSYQDMGLDLLLSSSGSGR